MAIYETPALQAAFQQGLLAELQGRQPQACPYPADSVRAVVWSHGYNSSQHAGRPARRLQASPFAPGAVERHSRGPSWRLRIGQTILAVAFSGVFGLVLGLAAGRLP